MKTFRQFLESKITKPIVVVYTGRFQPFHPGHKESYDNLVKKFGKDNVYIGTSNVVEPPKSPFNFKEKYKIITEMFSDIPKKNIVQIKNPFNPVEILNKYPKETIYITGVGKKDADRLKERKYFSEYSDKANVSYETGGYYYIIPKNKKKMKDGSEYSGTKVREVFKSKSLEDAFETVYGVKNNKILQLIGSKLHV